MSAPVEGINPGKTKGVVYENDYYLLGFGQLSPNPIPSLYYKLHNVLAQFTLILQNDSAAANYLSELQNAYFNPRTDPGTSTIDINLEEAWGGGSAGLTTFVTDYIYGSSNTMSAWQSAINAGTFTSADFAAGKSHGFGGSYINLFVDLPLFYNTIFNPTYTSAEAQPPLAAPTGSTDQANNAQTILRAVNQGLIDLSTLQAIWNNGFFNQQSPTDLSSELPLTAYSTINVPHILSADVNGTTVSTVDFSSGSALSNYPNGYAYTSGTHTYAGIGAYLMGASYAMQMWNASAQLAAYYAQIGDSTNFGYAMSNLQFLSGGAASNEGNISEWEKAIQAFYGPTANQPQSSINSQFTNVNNGLSTLSSNDKSKSSIYENELNQLVNLISSVLLNDFNSKQSIAQNMTLTG